MNLQVTLCDFELKIYICRKKESNKPYKLKSSIPKYKVHILFYDFYYRLLLSTIIMTIIEILYKIHRIILM